MLCCCLNHGRNSEFGGRGSRGELICVFHGIFRNSGVTSCILLHLKEKKHVYFCFCLCILNVLIATRQGTYKYCFLSVNNDHNSALSLNLSGLFQSVTNPYPLVCLKMRASSSIILFLYCKIFFLVTWLKSNMFRLSEAPPLTAAD